MASSETVTGAAGLMDMIYRTDPRKTEPVYRYVGDCALEADVLRLTRRSYGGYEPPKVPTPKPTLALLFGEVTCFSISTSLLGQRYMGRLQGRHSICDMPSHRVNFSTSSIAVFVILAHKRGCNLNPLSYMTHFVQKATVSPRSSA